MKLLKQRNYYRDSQNSLPPTGANVPLIPKKDITENQIRKEQGQNKRGAY